MCGALPPAMREGLGWGSQATPPQPPGGLGRGTGGGPARNHGATPPPAPPTPPPPARGTLEAGQGGANPLPPRRTGNVPPPTRELRHPGGERRQAHTLHAPMPPPACSHTDHHRQADPRQHTKAPRGPHLGSARGHEPEQYGGHSLNQLSDSNDTRFGARPGKAVGRTEVDRPPYPPGSPAPDIPGCTGPPARGHTTKS